MKHFGAYNIDSLLTEMLLGKSSLLGSIKKDAYMLYFRTHGLLKGNGLLFSKKAFFLLFLNLYNLYEELFWVVRRQKVIKKAEFFTFLIPVLDDLGPAMNFYNLY
jgi:hypothetical protein